MDAGRETVRGACEVERDVMVPMRDGVCLATDVWRPLAAEGTPPSPLPVILERTPYDKQGVSRSEVSATNPRSATRAEIAAFFAAHGFIVVTQDCRGRYRSQGTFRKYMSEAEDGYDTLEWILRQPWCNGKIGTMGFSYGAHTQCALACLNPPGLACMLIDSGGLSSAYRSGVRHGGAFELKQATWACRHALKSANAVEDPALIRAREEELRDWFRRMPWQPENSPLAATPEYERYLFEQWRGGTFSDYWRQPGLYAEGYYDSFPDIPTAIVGSWYDPYVSSSLAHYRELLRRNHSPLRLIMGPWTHGNRSVTFAGDIDFGRQATLDGNIADDYRELRLAWFRRWLRDVEPREDALPVSWFEMGGGSGRRNSAGRLDHGGRWRHARQWPPPTAPREFYFSADGLLRPAASGEAGYLEYRYDPDDPVPTIGGSLASGEPVMQGGAFDQRETPALFKYRGAPTGRPLSERADVLTFETPPLETPLLVTGDILVELFVSSDCPDTDFTAKLVAVYPPSQDFPEGFAMNLTDGIFRMRYRDGWDRETTMRPGEVCVIRIELCATSNLFQAGQRLRLDISSSNYPRFDINPNTGAAENRAGEFRIATNRVYVNGAYASRVVLPVVERE
jgi:hypothetical protein